jgi:hypothetical protein
VDGRLALLRYAQDHGLLGPPTTSPSWPRCGRTTRRAPWRSSTGPRLGPPTRAFPP